MRMKPKRVTRTNLRYTRDDACMFIFYFAVMGLLKEEVQKSAKIMRNTFGGQDNE